MITSTIVWSICQSALGRSTENCPGLGVAAASASRSPRLRAAEIGVSSVTRRRTVFRCGTRKPSARQTSRIRLSKAANLGFSFLSQKLPICSAMTRSISASSRSAPSGVPRFWGPRLEVRRVLRYRDTRRNKVDLGIPSCERATLTTSPVTFQPDLRSNWRRTSSRSSELDICSSCGSEGVEFMSPDYGRSTIRSIPF